MADEEKIVPLLKKVPLFRSLNRRQLRSLARISIEREYESGEEIIPQEREGYGFFIVTTGKAEAVRENADGSTTVVNTFGPSDYFGELALLDGGPHTATVNATEATTCVVIPRWNFMGNLRSDADMAVEILIEVTKRFRDALDRS